MGDDMKRKQTGLWIPLGVLSSDLSLNEKVLLADIIVLSIGSNKYLKLNKTIASMLSCSVRSVDRTISSLVEKNLIQSRITYPYGSVVKKRVLVPNLEQIYNLTNKNK